MWKQSILLQAFSDKCYRQRGCKLASRESSGDMFQQLLTESTPNSLLSRSKGSALWSDIELGSDLLGMSRVTSNRPRLLLWLQASGPTPFGWVTLPLLSRAPGVDFRHHFHHPTAHADGVHRWELPLYLLRCTPGIASTTSGPGILGSVMLGALFMPSCLSHTARESSQRFSAVNCLSSLIVQHRVVRLGVNPVFDTLSKTVLCFSCNIVLCTSKYVYILKIKGMKIV